MTVAWPLQRGLPLNQYSVLSVSLWSMQLWPDWNHASSSLSFLSNAILMRSKKTLCRTLCLPCWPACIWCQVSFYCGSDCLSFAAWLTDSCVILPSPSPHSISSCKGPQEPPLTPQPLTLIVSSGILSRPGALPLSHCKLLHSILDVRNLFMESCVPITSALPVLSVPTLFM